MIKKYYSGLYLGKAAIIIGLIIPLIIFPFYMESGNFLSLLILPFLYCILFMRKGVQIDFKSKTIRPFISLMGVILGSKRPLDDFPYYRKKYIDGGSSMYVSGVYQGSYSTSQKVLSIYDHTNDRDLILIKRDENKMKKLIEQLERIGIHKKKIKKRFRPIVRR